MEIQLKRSHVPGKIPTLQQLAFGEVAVNTYDGIVYIRRKNLEGDTIIAIGGNAVSGSATGSLFLSPLIFGYGLTPGTYDGLSIGNINVNPTAIDINLFANADKKLNKNSVSGTVGYIPLFTGSNDIGNSIISQNGSTVNISGSLKIDDVFESSGPYDVLVIENGEVKKIDGTSLSGSFVTWGEYNSFTSSYLQTSASFNDRINAISGSGSGSVSYVFTYPLTEGGGVVGINLNGYVTTSSFNSFLSSYNSFTQSIKNYTSSINNFTSSVTRDSASFDFRINAISSSNPDLSKYVTTSSFGNYTSSINQFKNYVHAWSQSINNKTGSFVTTSSFGSFTQSIDYFVQIATLDSASFDNRINAISSSIPNLSGYTTTSSFYNYTSSNNLFTQSIKNYTQSINQFTSSVTRDSASFDIRINAISSSTPIIDLSGYVKTGSFNNYTQSANVWSQSINNKTGSFVLTSSFNTYISLINTFTSSVNRDSASFDFRINNITFDTSSLLKTSSFNNYTSSLNLFSQSINNKTGSFVLTSSFNTFTSSFSIISASFNDRINAISGSGSGSLTYVFTYPLIEGGGVVGINLNGYVLTSSYNLYTSSINQFTSSVIRDSSSFDERINSISGSGFQASGSNNYISKFTTTGINESKIYQNNNYLIWNTPYPTDTTNVSPGAGYNGQSSLLISASAGIASIALLSGAINKKFRIGIDNANSSINIASNNFLQRFFISFTSGSITKFPLLITSTNQNIQIGDFYSLPTDNGVKLQVNGTIWSNNYPTASTTSNVLINDGGIISQISTSSLFDNISSSIKQPDKQVIFGTGIGITSSADLIWDYSNNRLGVGVTPTAILHISGSTTSASALRINGGSDVTSPNNGEIWYNNTNLYFYNGTSSIDLLSGGNINTSSFWNIAGNTLSTTGSLGSLNDVPVIIKHNGTSSIILDKGGKHAANFPQIPVFTPSQVKINTPVLINNNSFLVSGSGYNSSVIGDISGFRQISYLIFDAYESYFYSGNRLFMYVTNSINLNTKQFLINSNSSSLVMDYLGIRFDSTNEFRVNSEANFFNSKIKLPNIPTSSDFIESYVLILESGSNYIQKVPFNYISGSGTAISGSFVTLSSFNTFTSSVNADSKSFDNRINSISASGTSGSLDYLPKFKIGGGLVESMARQSGNYIYIDGGLALQRQEIVAGRSPFDADWNYTFQGETMFFTRNLANDDYIYTFSNTGSAGSLIASDTAWRYFYNPTNNTRWAAVAFDRDFYISSNKVGGFGWTRDFIIQVWSGDVFRITSSGSLILGSNGYAGTGGSERLQISGSIYSNNFPLISSTSNVLVNNGGVISQISTSSLFGGSYVTLSSFNSFTSSVNRDSASFDFRINSITGSGTGDFDAGSYTPTSSSLNNISSSFFYTATWTRVKKIVTVNIKMQVYPIISSNNTSWQMSLPPSISGPSFSNKFVGLSQAIGGGDRLVGGVTYTSGIFCQFLPTNTSPWDFALTATWEVP